MDNILPYDGVTHYFGKILSNEDADALFSRLLQKVNWQHDEIMLFGKRITTKRKTAWYGDDRLEYKYSGTAKIALPWIPELVTLKELAESFATTKFNSCLLNLYRDGSEGMSWHSDDEKSLGANPVIASISLGAERRFAFRHKKTKETVNINLEPGSILIMKGETQNFWHHSLPKALKISSPRINLTFRTIVQ